MRLAQRARDTGHGRGRQPTARAVGLSTLRVRVEITDTLDIGHEAAALRGVEAERAEDLRRLPVLLQVHEARVGVVLQEAVAVVVVPGDEPVALLVF